MAFPDLLPLTYANGVTSVQVCERTGVPDNGNNVIGLPWVSQGIAPAKIELDKISFRCESLNASVTGAAEVSLAADKQSATINFTQSGAGSAWLRATLHHSTTN